MTKKYIKHRSIYHKKVVKSSSKKREIKLIHLKLFGKKKKKKK